MNPILRQNTHDEALALAKYRKGNFLILAALAAMIPAIPSANAQLYWNTNGTLATWTTANWNTTGTGSTYSTAWTASSSVVFGVATGGMNNVTFATATVGDITVNGNTTITAAGTLSSKSGGSTVTVADNTTLTWSGQTFSSTGANFNWTKNGNGTWFLGTGNAISAAGTGGGVTLNAGTLIGSGDNSFGGANGRLTINGGIFSWNGSRAFSGAVVLGGNFGLTNNTANNASFVGSVDLTGVRTITNLTSRTFTFSGAITNTGGLILTNTATGTGKIVLSGANTFGGGVTLDGGSLELGSATGLGSGNLTINGGTLGASASTFAATNAINVNANFAIGTGSGSAFSGNVNLGGANRTITLNNSSTLSGAITNGGITLVSSSLTRSLTLDGAGSSYNGGFTLNSGTVVAATDAAFGTGTLTLQGGLLGWTNSRTITNAVSVAGNFGVTNTTANSITLSGPVNLSGIYTLTNNSGNSVNITGAITNAGGLILTNTSTGTASVKLSGNNTFGGGLTLDAGRLSLNSSTALGAGTFTINGGTIDNDSGAALAMANNNAQVWGGNFSFAGTTNLNLGTGSVNLSGSRTVTVDAAELTVGGSITNSGSLTKAGAGKLTLNGNNTYSGNTTVSAGTLELNGASTGAGAVIVNTATSILRLGATNALVNGVLSGNTSSTGVGTVELTVGGDHSLGAYGNSANVGNYMNFTNSSGTAATLTFTAGTNVANSATGGGRTITNSSANLSLVFNGALDISSSATNEFTVAGVGNTHIKGGVVNANTGVRGLIKTGAGTLTLEGNSTYNGATTISAGTIQIGNGGTSGNLGSGNVTNNAALVFNRSDSYTANNSISGTGSLTQSGAGTVTLSGANTFSGGTTVSAGTLAFGANDVLGSGSVSVNGGTVSLGTYSDTVGAVTLASGAITGSGGILTGSSYTVESGNISAILGGAVSLTKSTAGTVVLSGNNTYSGSTTVSAGVLQINGIHSGTGTVTVSGASSVLRLTQASALANAVLAGTGSSATAATVELAAGGDYTIGSYGKVGTGGGFMNFTNSSGAAASLTFTAATNIVTYTNNAGRTIANNSTNLNLVFNGIVDISSSGNNEVTFAGDGNTTIKGAVVNTNTGVRGLTKTGAGTLTLEGNNTYNGATTVSGGTLATVGNERLADGAAVSLATNTTLRLGGNETVATLAGDAGSSLNLQSYTLTVGGTGVAFTNSATTIGSGKIVKNGAQLLLLNNAANTYSGGFELNAGEVQFTSSGSAGVSSVFGTGTVVLNGGTIGSSSTAGTSGRSIFNAITLGGNVQFGMNSWSNAAGNMNSGSSLLTVSTNAGNATVLTADSTISTLGYVVWDQAISGNYRLTKSGAGANSLSNNFLSLRNSNNIAGLTVGSGIVGYKNRNALGTGDLILGDGVVVGQDGVINNPNLTGNDRTDRAIANNILLNGNVTFGLGGTANHLGGAMDLGGVVRTITLGNTTYQYGTVSNGGLVIDNGTAPNSRNFALLASNSYSGGTVVRTNAILSVGHNEALGTGNLVFTNTAGSGVATLRASTLSTAATQLRTITNNIQLASGMNVTVDAVSSAQDTSGNSVSVNLDTTLSGTISGGGGLTKTNSNKLTVTGANTYTGATTVDAGTLEVASGASIGSSATTVNSATLAVNGTAGDVTVNSGGTVKGSGTVGALSIASGGTLAAGNSPGALTASSATWNGGGIYSWEFSSAAGNESSFLTGQGTNWDFLNVTGVLDITASSGNEFIIDIVSLLALNDTSFDQNNNYSFAIATAAGGITNFLASDVSITGYLAGSNKWSLGLVNNTGTSQSLVLTYTGATAIPEPTTGGLIVIGLGLVAAFRRKRKA